MTLDRFDALTVIRDRALARLAQVTDPGRLPVVAVEGGALLRQVAFARWCPPCQDGAHGFGHAVAGFCSAIDRVSGSRCTCPWRP